MDHVYSTTTEHQKGKHLSYDERILIQVRLKDGWSANKIAKEIGCAPNTVRNEIRRGTVTLYNGRVQRYKAKAGQTAYEQHRSACGRHFDKLSKAPFLEYVDSHVREDKWSLDACFGRALQSGKFDRSEVVCTKTLYNYVDLGLMETRNHHLPEKLRRSTETRRVRENRKKLGRSIEERSPEIENREEFGNWEADLVIGKKSGKDQVLLTLAERKSRQYWMLPIKDREADSVMNAFKKLQETYSEHFSEVFKTITTDNGSEFSRLSELEWSSVKLTDRIFEKKYRYFMQLHLGRTVHNTPVHRLLEPGSGSDYGYALYYKMLRYTQIPTDVHVLCSRW